MNVEIGLRIMTKCVCECVSTKSNDFGELL